MSKNRDEQFQLTTIPSLKLNIRRWYFADLKDQVIGRVATKVVEILRGKNKKDFTYNFDLGNYIVLINAKFIKLTGNKINQGFYYEHSGYSLRKRSTKVMVQDYSKELIFRIIKGMMPNNRLAKKQLKRLFIFSDNKHNLIAQEKNFINLNL